MATLVAATLAVALAVVWYAIHELLLLFAGLLLSVYLAGLTEVIARWARLGRGTALAVTIVLLVTVAGGTGWMLAPEISSQVDQLVQRVPASIHKIETEVGRYEWGKTLLPRTGDQTSAYRSAVLSNATSFAASTVGLLVDVVIVVFVVFVGVYLAADPSLYRRGVLRVVPSARRDRAAEILDAVSTTLRLWLLTRAFAMCLVGALTALGLWLLGVQLALTLGLLAAAMTFLPYVGAILSAAPAILIAFMQSPMMAAYVAALFVIVHVVEGYFLTPLVEQRTVWLPPALSISAQLLLGTFVGVLGLVLASPITASILVLVKMIYIEDWLGERADVPGGNRAR